MNIIQSARDPAGAAVLFFNMKTAERLKCPLGESSLLQGNMSKDCSFFVVMFNS